MPKKSASSPCHAGSPTPVADAASCPIHRLKSVSSTNDLAAQWLRQTDRDAPAAWVAQEQTGGKGTRGRAWASPVGGLWMSMACPTRICPDQVVSGLAMRVGLAALRACRATLPTEPALRLRLKWPNDLVACCDSPTPSKVAGVLIERSSVGVVIGIGINANNRPPMTDPSGRPLRAPALSLSDLAECQIDLPRLESELIRSLCELVPVRGLPPSLYAEANAALWRPDHPVTIHRRDGSTITGVIAGFSAEPDSIGWLILSTPTGEQLMISSGDIE